MNEEEKVTQAAEETAVISEEAAAVSEAPAAAEAAAGETPAAAEAAAVSEAPAAAEAAGEAPAATETAGEAPAAAETAGEAPAAAETAGEAPAAAEAPAEESPAPTETMADYEDAIKASMKPIHEGDILNVTVIGISDDELVVDFGGYTDGVIKREDASDDPDFTFRDYQKGQQLSATVIQRDNAQGRIQLSLKAAAAVLGWERLQQLMKDQANITVKIAEAVKSGVTAYVEGIRGFIPASKLALTYVENLDEWVGREIEVRVITAEKEGKRLVLSARDILREKEAEERKKRISNVEVGLVTEGTVETIKPYGAFIRLSNGLSGLVHVSQISQQRIKTPAAVLKEGETVKVKIIGVKDGKISLSMKALQDVTAEKIEEETYEMPKVGEATTSLASLFKNLKL